MAAGTRRLSPAFGMEVLGIDLSQPLSDGAFDEIERLFNEHSLLLFRDQDFSERQHVDLSRRFGTLQSHVLKPYLKADYPEILVLSNIVEDGRPLGIGDAGQLWHSDTSYIDDPCRCSLLYAREVPAPDGDRTFGDTLFSSLAAAYDGLPDEMKARLSRLSASHSYQAYYARKQAEGSKRPALSKAQQDEVPPVVHPVIRPHPITGRKAVYVNEGYTTELIGLPAAESGELLQMLFRHCTSDAFTYRHQWRKGDLLIWDNSATQHLAIGDYALPQRRLMHRTTVLAS